MSDRKGNRSPVRSRKRNSMKDKYKFKGWDWAELVPILGMEEEFKNEIEPWFGDDSSKIAGYKFFHEAEEAFGKKMGNKMRGYPYDHTEKETKLFIKHLRAFLKVIISEDKKITGGAYKPFYKGILKIKHHDVFLSVYSHNLTCMWT